MSASYSSKSSSVRVSVVQLALLSFLWFVLVSHPQHILDSHLPSAGVVGGGEPQGDQLYGGSSGFTTPVRRLAPSPDVGRYIIYRGQDQRPGQGIGNLMNGLLAAHLMGEEFNRIVCVYWEDFELAFERTRYDDICDKLPHDDDAMLTYPQIVSWNFGPSQHECQIVDALSSPDMPVVSFNGNTYPKWPLVPNNFFDSYYAATRRLQSTLPWNEGEAPAVVVHLRKADGSSDSRKGLDDNTLQALGERLPRNTTFLVTNNVQWYKHFATRFGWQTPGWEGVTHSALGHIRWGNIETTTTTTTSKQETARQKQLNDALTGLDTKQVQMMHLWSDWYTVLRAQEVYHTHSDFSLSAIHWSNITSRTIMGMEQLQPNQAKKHEKEKDDDNDDDNDDNGGRSTSPGQLVLEEEAWRRDGEMPPLRHRARESLTTRDGQPCHTFASDASGLYPLRRKRHEFALLDAEEFLEQQGMLKDRA